MSNDWQKTLQTIVLADTISLKELALLAGADPKYFYRTARILPSELNDIDVKGVTLPGSLKSAEVLDERTSRLVVKMSSLVHLLIKRGNPNALSAHVSVLLRVFLDEHLEKVEIQRLSAARLEAELILKILEDFRVSGLAVDHFKIRRTVSYSIDSELKTRVFVAAFKAGRSQSDFVRIALYYCLLNDPIRNIDNYNMMFREEAIVSTITDSSKRDLESAITIERLRSNNPPPTEFRHLLDGVRYTYTIRKKY